MRVIAGSAKRIQLKTPKGIVTRPTSDRIKETLFNMIAPDIRDCRFLDLFSGSGAIGIEALSRGASGAVFVERSKGAVACIRENLSATRLKGRANVLHMDVFLALKMLHGQERFDYIFMDPPYTRKLEESVLERLSKSDILDEQSIVIVEMPIDAHLSHIQDLGYTIIKSKEYKTSKHVFISYSR